MELRKAETNEENEVFSLISRKKNCVEYIIKNNVDFMNIISHNKMTALIHAA